MKRGAHVENACENQLRELRREHGLSERDMADLLEKKSINTYSCKERGLTAFTANEMVIISKNFGMNFDTFNSVFFNGKLQFCNE